MIAGLSDFAQLDPASSLGLLLLLAIVCGELVQRWLRLPRLCGYVLAGLFVGPSGMAWLPAPLGSDLRPLLWLGLGLLLFELGSRVDLRWLRANPPVLLTSLTESALCFASIYILLRQFDFTPEAAYAIGAIAVATSPTVVIAVVIESRARGQVTQRLQLLSALNTLYSIGLLMLGEAVIESSTLSLNRLQNPLLLVCASFLAACMLAIAIGRWIPRLLEGEQARLLATLALVLLTAMLVQFYKLSLPLVFLGGGLLLRHFSERLRIFPDHFGGVGGLAALLLFALTGASLSFSDLTQGGVIALMIIATRVIAKYLGVICFAGRGGLSPAKAHCLGLALTPMSTIAVLQYHEQAGRTAALAEPMFGAAILASVLIMELLGPPLSSRAIARANEADANVGDGRHGA